MIVKEKFELFYAKDQEVYNVPRLTRSSLSAYQIPKNDFDYLVDLINVYSRTKKHNLGEYVLNNAKKMICVKIDSYPLPGFVTKGGLGVVNLSVLPVEFISDYNSGDIYAMFLYTMCLQSFVRNRPFGNGIEQDVANMLFSIFMKMYGKKSGLIGSYQDLIPRLVFLTQLYCFVSMMGHRQSDDLYHKISSNIYRDVSDLNLNFDFRSTNEYLRAINENRIIPISGNKLSIELLKYAGISGLPVFEDMSRFFATMVASNVSGNGQFSFFYYKVNKQLYGKLLNFAYIELKKTKLTRG